MGVATAFQQVLEEFAPLFGLSFAIFALKGFRLSHSARWVRGFWTHLLDIIFSSAVGAFLIVSLCIIIMATTPGLNGLAIIGLAIFLSVGGFSLVDRLVSKYLGVRLFDHDTTDIKGELHRNEEEK